MLNLLPWPLALWRLRQSTCDLVGGPKWCRPVSWLEPTKIPMKTQFQIKKGQSEFFLLFFVFHVEFSQLHIPYKPNLFNLLTLLDDTFIYVFEHYVKKSL